MEKAGVQIELLTRSIVSNFTVRLLGPLKETKSQKNLGFFMSRLGALTHLGAIKQNTDCHDKQSILNFYEERALHIISLTSHKKPAGFKCKIWLPVENKLAELFKVYIFQDGIITIK